MINVPRNASIGPNGASLHIGPNLASTAPRSGVATRRSRPHLILSPQRTYQTSSHAIECPTRRKRIYARNDTPERGHPSFTQIHPSQRSILYPISSYHACHYQCKNQVVTPWKSFQTALVLRSSPSMRIQPLWCTTSYLRNHKQTVVGSGVSVASWSLLGAQQLLRCQKPPANLASLHWSIHTRPYHYRTLTYIYPRGSSKPFRSLRHRLDAIYGLYSFAGATCSVPPVYLSRAPGTTNAY